MSSKETQKYAVALGIVALAIAIIIEKFLV